MTKNIIEIELGQIKPSKTNPRKTFDDKKLAELAESIKSFDEHGECRGVLTPISVRPNPHDDVKKFPYEINFGERRWRASKLAGMPTIRAIVEDLSEHEVLERQLIENVQREDVHPIEEAEAYKKLHDSNKGDIRVLVAKTGKSEAHIYGRIKLATALCAKGKKACLAGELPASHAEFIARQFAGFQDELVDVALGKTEVYHLKNHVGGNQDDIEGEQLSGEEIGGNNGHYQVRQPLSFRALQLLVYRCYSTRLADAKFELDDAQLVPKAGACTVCPHRSGSQPELFATLVKPADVCTRPSCFASKNDALFQIAKKSAAARGVEVITEKEAEKDYVDPDAELPWDLRSTLKGNAKDATWGKLLGKKAHELPTAIVKDETGAPVEVIDKKAAIAALKESGKIDKPSKPASSHGAAYDADKKERAKEKAKSDLKAAAFVRVLGMVAEDLDGFTVASDTANKAGKKTVATLKWIATRILEDAQEIDYERVEGMVVRRGLGANDAGEAIGKAIDKAKTAGQVLSIIVELQLAVIGDSIERGSGYHGEMEAFKTGCELFGADWAKAQELAKAAAAAEAKVDSAKAKKGGKAK